jgi:nucleosome binding factor SPN SPT16 subunit
MSEWKQVQELPGYQISNTGEVRFNGEEVNIFKSFKNQTIRVPIGSFSVTVHVKELVANYFIDNPNGYKFIKEKIPGNAEAKNLEWTDTATFSYGNKSYKINSKTGEIVEFKTMKALAKDLDISTERVKAAFVKNEVINGFIIDLDVSKEQTEVWKAKYIKPELPTVKVGVSKVNVNKFDLQGKLLQTYGSIQEAVKENQISIIDLTLAAKNFTKLKNYKWSIIKLEESN